MANRHVQYGNNSEAAQCYLHSAGLIAEYLKLTGSYSSGCSILDSISSNIRCDEGKMELDVREGHEQRYTEGDLVVALEQALTQLEKAELYELMTPVFKILLPYYESDKNYKILMEVYGRLYESHKKIVSIMSTGRRFLGTYYRVGFYGDLFGEDHNKEFVYREPKVTSLPELTLRLQRMYSKKFGPEAVQMIHDSNKVDISTLDPDKGYIQVTHVMPYFTEEELMIRNTQFEHENSINRFVYETPFTESGKAHGTVASQCMRKTILTTIRCFPYIIKKILVKDTEIKEISPIEVAIEAMEKKGRDLAFELERENTDLVKLQLLLQGSISAQVNQGVQEYANVFLKDIKSQKYLRKFTDHLKQVYRMFLDLCEKALALHGQLITKEQQLLQNEMMHQYQSMKLQLGPILDPPNRKRLATTHSAMSLPPSVTNTGNRRPHPPPVARAATSVIIPAPTTI